MAYDGTIVIDTEIDAGGFERGLAELWQMADEAAAGLSVGMLAAGSELAAGLAEGFIAGGGRLAAAVPGLLGAATAALAAGQAGMAGAGRGLMEGLWQGMQGAQGWLMAQINGLCAQVMAGIKGFFGIASPAKRLADEVGRWLPPGIGMGFSAAMPALRRDVMRQLGRFSDEAAGLVRAGQAGPAPAGGFGRAGEGAARAGNTYYYTQQVYTHDSLSPYELTQEFEGMRAREGWAIP